MGRAKGLAVGARGDDVLDEVDEVFFGVEAVFLDDDGALGGEAGFFLLVLASDARVVAGLDFSGC